MGWHFCEGWCSVHCLFDSSCLYTTTRPECPASLCSRVASTTPTSLTCSTVADDALQGSGAFPRTHTPNLTQKPTNAHKHTRCRNCHKQKETPHNLSIVPCRGATAAAPLAAAKRPLALRRLGRRQCTQQDRASRHTYIPCNIATITIPSTCICPPLQLPLLRIRDNITHLNKMPRMRRAVFHGSP